MKTLTVLSASIATLFLCKSIYNIVVFNKDSIFKGEPVSEMTIEDSFKKFVYDFYHIGESQYES